MKNVHTTIAKAVAAMIFASCAGIAGATGADQLIAVSATVSEVCVLTAGAGWTMTFPAIDPSSAGPVTAPTTVSYKCTNGVTPTITATPGGMLGTMAYSVAVSGVQAGTGFSSAVNATITGSIPQTSFVDSVAGTFTDTVTVHINK